MKVDQASSVEPRPSQISVNSSSAALAGNSKVSKFGLRSGFVIPKNKLSGSLVPIFRGAGKVESDTVKEESHKPIQRKTKWGTDLTQDATVRKGRALAYQTRVEQITKQLKSGALEKGDDDLSPQSPNEVPNDESSRHQSDEQSQKLEMLEFEKREAIGEILKLNPSYKAPVDYKPLMKEAIIPVPVKLYPGLNFVGLILGSGSNTQKRLEEETGARIQLQGTKAGSVAKVVISDKNDVQGAYEELYVHVSADTFEKVDAAVGLIELLFTPVSGNSVMVSTTQSSVSGDSASVHEHSQDTTSSQVMPGPLANQGMMQSMVGPMQPGFVPQLQFQPYAAPWFPTVQMRPPNNFGPPSNFSAPMPNNVIQFPSPPLNSSNMPQFFVGHPPSGSTLAPRTPSHVSPIQQPPLQGFQWPYFREPPPNSQALPLRMGSQPHVAYPSLPAQPNPAMPHQGAGNQPRTTGPGPRPGPGPTMLSQSQPFSPAPSGQAPNIPLASSGWSASTVTTPSQPVLFQRPPLMTSGTAPSNVPATITSGPAGNMLSPASFPYRPSTPHSSNTLVNHPVPGQNFSFVIHQRPSNTPSSTLVPLQAPSSMMPLSPAALSAYPPAPTPVLTRAPTPAPTLSPSLKQSPPVVPTQSMVGAAPVPPPPPSALPQLSVNPNSITTPKPQRPSSGDFTFQPLGSPLPLSRTVPRPNDQPPSEPPKSIMQPPPAPQTPSYQPAVHNSRPQMAMQGFPSTRPCNQMIQSQPQVRPPSFSGNPSPVGPPPRFTQPPQMSNFSGRFPPQMMNPPQLQQNQPSSTMRPRGFLVPNQHYGNNPTSSGRPAPSHSGNQVYDPFSPSSVSSAPQQQPENPVKVRKQEDDPEYDDLMASVGVR